MEFTPHPAWHHEESLNSSSCDKDLHVLVPTKTYSTTAIISLTKEHVPIQSDTFLLSVKSYVHSLSVEASTFSKEDASFPFGSENESTSDGELRIINIQSSSPKYQAWHSLKRLAWTVPKFAPWIYFECTDLKIFGYSC
jgi:hypothetical protein